MLDMHFFYAAITIMVIIIVREILRKKFAFDMDNVSKEQLKALFSGKGLKASSSKLSLVIEKSSGSKNLILKDVGANKATVMATLRQITGIDYNTAKGIVNSAPIKFMTNISEKEADLTKKALEFVGAKVEVE